MGDGRENQASNDVSLTVTNTAAAGTGTEARYYTSTGTDKSKLDTKTVAENDTLTTSVEDMTSGTTANKGTETNPYTLDELSTMTRAEYVTAQKELGGTMYVTVGDYSYDTNGVLGNGERNDTPGQTPDHSKLNAYGENGYLGDKNDGANGKNIVFVGGSITSGATGYTSIDHIGTSLLLAVPAYTNVTFQNVTFNNVMSFDYQLYTSSWSQLGEVFVDETAESENGQNGVSEQTETSGEAAASDQTVAAQQGASLIWLWVMLGVIAAAAMCVVMVVMRKKKK